VPITQDRLIRLIQITERATTVTQMHKRLAQKFLHQFHNEISDNLCEKDRETIVSFIAAFANTIIDYEMSPQDYMDFREEQIHFKYTQKRNELNKNHQRRHRAKLKALDTVRQEEILLAEDFAAMNNTFANLEQKQAQEQQNHPNPTQEPTFSSFDPSQLPHTDPASDPERAQYERERDERLKNYKPITGIVPKTKEGD